MNYEPPKVWQMDEGENNGGAFANINRPTAGARQEKSLPVGNHPLQLYSLATPNGVKVTIMLEELLAIGHGGAEYDAYTIDIGSGAQFDSGFVDINPNSKIPALLDKNNGNPIRLFESGSILMYLAEKFNAFLPSASEPVKRAETLNWVFWNIGSAPFLGGGFGHFFSYAPEKLKYSIDRYAMETKRQLDVLDRRLADNKYLIGDDYTIADIINFPWYGMLVKDKLYKNAGEFLAVHEYKNVNRWADMLLLREPVLRGRVVNRTFGPNEQQLRERHSAEDFEKVDVTFRYN